MATETKTKDKAPAGANGSKNKGGPRPSAVVPITVDSALDESRFSAPDARRTQWDTKLDEVYALTEAGSVPRNEETGKLQFVRLGHYGTVQGAKAQKKAFVKRELDKTYEFRINGTDLYVRVIEVDDAAV